MILPIFIKEIKAGGICPLPEKITYSYDVENSDARFGAEAFGKVPRSDLPGSSMPIKYATV